MLLLLLACVQDPPPADTGSAPDGDRDGIADVSDCAPTDPEIPAEEDGCDGIDSDCNGLIDDDATTTTWYGDDDGDGAGDPEVTLDSCAQPVGYVAEALDCDPGDPAVWPGAPEFCDDIDNDCDGAIDDITETLGLLTWYRDADGDGWGVASDTTTACFVPEGYVITTEDCDDADPAVNPGAPEVCDDADLDENCNGAADDDDWAAGGAAAWTDRDRDGWGVDLVWRCEADASLAPEGGDCNDRDAAISPGAVDTCGDGLDTDCDGEDPTC